MFDQSTRRIALLLGMVLVTAMVVAPGCSKKPKPVKDVVQPPPPVEQPVEAPPAEPEEPKREFKVEDVFFDYDKYNLREDARRTLEVNARMLLDYPSASLVLEGHCDERGTVEYNLALGERRAQSVKNYLVEFGVDPGQLTTISYGEEKPFAQGHDESAWSENRRVHFVKK